MLLSTTERPISTVQNVERGLFSKDHLYGPNHIYGQNASKLNWEGLRDHLKKEGRLALDAALELINRTTEQLKTEKNVLYRNPPLTCMTPRFALVQLTLF